MESPAVRKHWGSHLLHWINNDNKQLNEAATKSLNYGYSRLEMTSYMNTLPDDNLINRNFEYVYNIIRQASYEAIFYNSINNQFTAIMDEVREILFTYDKTKQKHLFQIRWFNSLSHKMNAVLFKNVGYSSNRMINIMGRCTFNNNPIKVVMVECDENHINESTDGEDDNENELSIIDNDYDEADDKIYHLIKTKR